MKFEQHQENSAADWIINQLILLYNEYASKIDVSLLDDKNKEQIIPLVNGIMRLIKGDKS